MTDPESVFLDGRIRVNSIRIYINYIDLNIEGKKILGRNWIELFDFFEGLDPDYIGLWSDPVPGFS